MTLMTERCENALEALGRVDPANYRDRVIIVRTIIEAMREPAMDQCIAGAYAADIRPSEAKAVFNAMISAALAPPGEG
jgi:uncharacterized membrane protein